MLSSTPSQDIYQLYYQCLFDYDNNIQIVTIMLRACMSFIKPALLLMRGPGFAFASEGTHSPTLGISKSSQPLPHMAQKATDSPLLAIWADRVTKQIAECQPQKLTAPLIDRLRALQLSDVQVQRLNSMGYGEQKIKEARQQYMKAIDIWQGVQISPGVINSQDRIKDARKNSKELKLAFYPNSFATSTIFKTVGEISMVSRKTMSVGKPGISKSMAYVFACYNSQISSAYRYLHSEKAKKLVESGLLNKFHTKILFINFHDSQPNTANIFAQNLADQCPEIKQTLLKVAKNFAKQWSSQEFEDFVQKIAEIYKLRGIQTLIILDQINTVARKYREYNLYTAKTKRNQTLSKDQGKKYLGLMKEVPELFDIISGCKKYQRLLFNSSANIEKQILDDSKPHQHVYFTLNLNHHSPIALVHCQFGPQFFKSVQVQEMYRFIWYQVAKKVTPQDLQKHNLDKQSLEKLFIKKCDELADKQKFCSFLTPLSIREEITKEQKAPELTQKKIQQFLKEKFQNVRKTGLQTQKNKSYKFINDADVSIRNQKLELALACWNYLTENETSNSIPVSGTPLSKFKKDIQKLMDKDLYFYSSAGGHNLQLVCSRSQIFQIYTDTVDQMIYTPENSELILEVAKKNNTVRGLLIQNTCIELIEAYKYCIFALAHQKFIIRQFSTFEHFVKSTSIDLSLQNIFAVARTLKSQDYYCFARPLMKQGKSSTTSPSIDLMGARYLANSRKFDICSFDFTVSSQFSAIETKCAKFKELLGSQLTNVSNPAINQIDQKTYENILSLLRAAKEMVSMWKSEKPETGNLLLFLGAKKINENTNKKRRTIAQRGQELLQGLESQSVIIDLKKAVMKIDKSKSLEAKDVSNPVQAEGVNKSVETEDTNKGETVGKKEKILNYLDNCLKNAHSIEGIKASGPKRITSWTHYIICRQNHYNNREKVERSFNVADVQVFIKLSKMKDIDVMKIMSQEKKQLTNSPITANKSTFLKQLIKDL